MSKILAQRCSIIVLKSILFDNEESIAYIDGVKHQTWQSVYSHAPGFLDFIV